MIDVSNEIKEVFAAVSTINDEVYDFLSEHGGEYDGDKAFYILDLHTDGNAIVVNFLDSITIWSFEDERREFIEDKDVWEPIEGYLRKEVKKLLDSIGSIKLTIKEVKV